MPFHTIKNQYLVLSKGRAREDKHRMLTDDEFAKMLEDCRENGGVNDGILRAVESIAKRILRGSQHQDEIAQAVLIRFCKIWRRIDCSRNVHAFIAAMVRNEKRMFFRSLNRKQRLFVNESRFATGFDFAVEKLQARVVRAIYC